MHSMKVSYYINSGTLIAVDDVEFIFLMCFIVQSLNYEYISKETLLFFSVVLSWKQQECSSNPFFPARVERQSPR